MSTSRPRSAGLDLVRAGAMLLGLAYHATYAWLPDIARWYFVADASPVPGLVTVTGVLHAFRMQVFFALSGYFSHLVLDRRGVDGFLTDRVRRLVVPFLVAWPVVLVLDQALRAASLGRGLMAVEYGPQAAWRVTPVHLWFLVYLFAFCAVAWALAKRGWTGHARLAWLVKRPELLLLVFAVPTCAGLWWHPENRPDAHLWPTPFEVLHYGGFFACGWLLWPVREALGAVRARGPVYTALGAALGLYVFSRPLQWEPLGHVASGVVAWLLTLGLLGLALRVPDGERPGLRFLVESSYWVYLVHYPVVLGLQLAFAQLGWPGLVEYGLTVGLTAGVAFVTFALFVRPTRLGPWLGATSKKT